MAQPYIDITYSVIRQDIANNRSLIKINLRLNEAYNVRFSANKRGVLQGGSFTYSGGAYGAGSWILRSREIWVGHNSDGTKSLTLSGSFGINITYSGSWIGTLTTERTVNLPKIPRQSDLTFFNIRSWLEPNTENLINLTIDRKYSGFTHTIDLRYGDKIIASWAGLGTPSTLELTGAEVNSILNSVPNTTKPTLSLVMTTRDSNNKIIGGTSIQRFQATIHTNVKPSITNFKMGISGSNHDKTINEYVQGITKPEGSFNASAGYGASIVYSNIIVQKSDEIDRQSIDGEVKSGSFSGVTENAVTRTGIYQVWAFVRDSRGRTERVESTITVRAYSQPEIILYQPRRKQTNGTIVENAYSGKWSNISGKNKLAVKIEYQLTGSTGWNSVVTETLTSGSFNKTKEQSNISETSSYVFRLVIRDEFNNDASVVYPIGTSSIAFNIFQDVGVGIGKWHERGVMDLLGDAFIDGNLFLNDLPMGIDSGENSNGRYIKHPDGTVFCEIYDARDNLSTQTLSKDGYTIKRITLDGFDLPTAHIDTPQYSVIASVRDGSAPVIADFIDNGSTNNYIRFDIRSLFNFNRYTSMRIITMGRWKE